MSLLKGTGNRRSLSGLTFHSLSSSPGSLPVHIKERNSILAPSVSQAILREMFMLHGGKPHCDGWPWEEWKWASQG